MLGKVDWLSFLGGVLFSMFVLPFLMNLIAKFRGTSSSANRKAA